MNEHILIPYCIIGISIFIRTIYFDFISTIHLLLSSSVLIALGTIIFLFYDTWLEDKISEKDLKRIINNTYKDIDNITKITKDKDLKEPEFKEDAKDDERNKKLVRDSFIIGFGSLGVFVLLLYMVDKNFYYNFYRTLLSIIIIYIVEIYFSRLIFTDFRGEGYENIRHDIINKILEL